MIDAFFFFSYYLVKDFKRTNVLSLALRLKEKVHVTEVTRLPDLLCKGPLISKCLLGVIFLTSANIFLCTRAEVLKKFRWFFGRKDDTKKTFQN